MSSYNPQSAYIHSTTTYTDIITHIVWSVWRIHPLPIEEKATGLDRLALPFAEGIHELLQLRRPLDLEEDFVVVVGDFDVDVARLLRLFCGSVAAW
jgi:hypothetical protein